jgi:gliding motility-associated-like protein
VTDLFGCVNFDTILVDVFANVIADAGADIDTCANVPIPLQASGGVSYFWNDSINLNFNDIANPLAFPNDDIEFVVEVTDSNGCIGYDTLQVSVFVAFVSNDTLICQGDNYQASIFGDIPSAVTWSPTDGVSNPNIANPILSPEETTTYLIDINNSEGCTITDTLLIEVPVVEATFDTLINPGCNGLEVKYTNTSNPEFNFYWIFSDNDTSVNDDVIKEFYFGSDFYGTLFVQDTNGCLDSRSYGDSALNFDDYFTISDPNIFTPNGDNMNDEFIIEIPEKVEKCAELTIYNRWGQIQYFSTGNNLKWDGKNRVGGLAPPGSYFYTLKIQEKNFSGVLNLMR